MTLDRTIFDEATVWAVRTSDPEFGDWPGFTAWLERSPEHAAAYDHVMAAVETGSASVDTVPANDVDQGASRRVGRWLGPAIAACLALVAVLWIWPLGGAGSTYRTEPGEMQTIALADGSTIVLAGDTELVVDPDRTRYARLEQGRALFEIRHDESNPFRVDVGHASLVDAGTIFDVSILRSDVGVAVSEGAVIFNPSKENARIEPGQLLTFDRGDSTYRISDVPLAQIGEWREGRLTFRDLALADVAAEISRVSGIAYTVSGSSGDRPVSGSIVIEPLRADPAALGSLLGVEIERRGDTWMLSAR